MLNSVAHGIDASFKMTVRKFPEVIEVTVKPVNHMLELARSRSHGLKKAPSKVELPEEERARKDEENKLRAIRRAKQSIRWLVHRLKADHLVTLTYRDNMQDTEQLKRDFDQFRRLMLARYPDWKYVAAREQQERGAWHLHLAVQGRQDIKYMRTCWYKVLGCLGATGKDVMGQVDVVGPRKRFGQPKGTWKSAKLASYLTKYLDKSFNMLEHSSKRYWASKGAPKPEVVQHWLGSQNITEMIKDAFDIAMLHGLEDFPAQIMQSRDRTLLWLSGARNLRLSFSNSFDLAE
ncbi:rolling circle replication-associated protein [Methylobacillus flagellatus]|uniref:Replication-associated protein ORF2/G2P domain-containing protein n=1 Tax=Methylobacillus flagellatus (strain ATCC 51484 / DSM 6875 / VKM B-1610 / KT) TaxID=265072 RepID=Q1H1B3_METFK|nr:hypothetical protein [Methylobacillus flagellatus]ABE49724.1 hypothetical protein Mfla_1456 [Methylobacillus flagellatus KT]